MFDPHQTREYWYFAYTPLQQACILEIMRLRAEEGIDCPESIALYGIKSDSYSWNVVLRADGTGCVWRSCHKWLHADGTLTEYDEQHLPGWTSAMERAMLMTLRYDDLYTAAQKYYCEVYSEMSSWEEMERDAARTYMHERDIRRPNGH